MKNYIQPGDTMTFTAPAGGVVSGNAYLIGGLLVVALATVAATEEFAGVAVGVHDLPKNTAQAWTEGAVLWWDDTNKRLDTTNGASAFFRVGCAAASALAADATGPCRLNGSAVVAG